MNIGENIRKLRKSHKLTLKELGLRVGLSEQAIGQYERGDRTPNIETLDKLAKALDVHLSNLLRDSDSVDIGSLQSKTFDAMFRDHCVSNSDKNELFNHNLKMNSLYNDYFHDLFFWKTRTMNPHEFFNFILSISPFTEIQFLSKEDIEELSIIFYRFLQLKSIERNHLTDLQDDALLDSHSVEEFEKTSFLKTENNSKNYSIHTLYDK